MFNRAQDLILPIAIITSVLVIMVPLPAALMDVLLAANITVAVLVLLTTIYVRQPLEFSVFPSMLLATLTLTSNSSPGATKVGTLGDSTKSPRTSAPLLNTPTESAATATAMTRSLPLK